MKREAGKERRRHAEDLKAKVQVLGDVCLCVRVLLVMKEGLGKSSQVVTLCVWTYNETIRLCSLIFFFRSKQFPRTAWQHFSANITQTGGSGAATFCSKLRHIGCSSDYLKQEGNNVGLI